MHVIEKTIAENIKVFSPQNLQKELLFINKVYEDYKKDVTAYVKSIDELLLDLNDIYKEVYFQCLDRIGGLNFFTGYGYVIMQVAKKLMYLKTEWSIHEKRLQSFINKLKKTTSKFIMLTTTTPATNTTITTVTNS